MIQKIQIEIDVPEGFEFVRYGAAYANQEEYIYSCPDLIKWTNQYHSSAGFVREEVDRAFDDWLKSKEGE